MYPSAIIPLDTLRLHTHLSIIPVNTQLRQGAAKKRPIAANTPVCNTVIIPLIRIAGKVNVEDVNVMLYGTIAYDPRTISTKRKRRAFQLKDRLVAREIALIANFLLRCQRILGNTTCALLMITTKQE